jgi:hypothetical protein
MPGCRFFALLGTFAILTLALVVLFRTTHDGPNEETGVASRAWLKLNPPRKARHDAELLRRRMLGSLLDIETEDELATHAPQLVACLDNDDLQVRQLALQLLERLHPQVLAGLASELSEVLGGPDDEVQLYVLRTLRTLADVPAIASSGPDIIDSLTSQREAIRLAAVEALAVLEPEDIAPYTQAALEVVLKQHDARLAASIVANWSAKLQTNACRERAGAQACDRVLEQIQREATGHGNDAQSQDGPGGGAGH